MKMDPVNSDFFIELLSRTFNEPIEIGNQEESELLLESIFTTDTFLYYKKWKYTFLFSGESRLYQRRFELGRASGAPDSNLTGKLVEESNGINKWQRDYDCVLYGQKNHANIINVPLFIPYLFCNPNKIVPETKTVPKKNICAVITNLNGKERNAILDKIEQKIAIDYAGDYRNNIPRIPGLYNSQTLLDTIAEYKFVITMENSREETYITEKITHGFKAGNIPIYWGSLNVTDYFYEDRFINIPDHDNIDNAISKILELIEDDAKYLEVVNREAYRPDRTIDHIVKDIQNLLCKPYTFIQKIYTICNPVFEPTRYNRLNQMFHMMGISNHNVNYLCPTYKHTITDEIMAKYVKDNLVKTLRPLGMKKSEISLFLNYKAVLEHILRNYSDGLFFIFESDIIGIAEKMPELNAFVTDMFLKKDRWDLIHIGQDIQESDYFGKPYCEKPKTHFTDNYIEDITTEHDKYRIFRKTNPRCMDSCLWNYNGVVKFLDYMNTNPYYDFPLDHYLIDYMETHLEFKYYWSMDTFFIQASNFGIEPSAIQTDIE